MGILKSNFVWKVSNNYHGNLIDMKYKKILWNEQIFMNR